MWDTLGYQKHSDKQPLSMYIFCTYIYVYVYRCIHMRNVKHPGNDAAVIPQNNDGEKLP